MPREPASQGVLEHRKQMSLRRSRGCQGRRLQKGRAGRGGAGGAGQQEALGAEWSVCWAEPEGVPPAEGPCPANDMVLCLLHGCLGQELSDRELPLPAADQAAFLREVLRRTRHSPGEPPPLSRHQTLQSGSRLGSGLPFPASQSSALPSTSTFIVGPEGPPVGDPGILKDQAGSSAQAIGDPGLPNLVSTGASGLSSW